MGKIKFVFACTLNYTSIKKSNKYNACVLRDATWYPRHSGATQWSLYSIITKFYIIAFIEKILMPFTLPWINRVLFESLEPSQELVIFMTIYRIF